MKPASDRVGLDENGRAVYLTHCASLRELIATTPPAGRYVLLLCANTNSIPSEELFTVAERLLETGAVYVASWGEGCERLEDILDEAHVYGTLGRDVPTLTTTSHEHDDLCSTLAFVAIAAQPVAEYRAECSTVWVVTVGNVDWYNEAANCLEDLVT